MSSSITWDVARKSGEPSAQARERRSAFFMLRGVLCFVVLALLALQHPPASASLWLLGTSFLLSNLALLVLPSTWFEKPGVAYAIFLLDMAGLTWLICSLAGINSELLLLYYLTIFMAALGGNLARSVEVACVAGVVYLGLGLNGQPGLLADPKALLSVPLFFTTALCCGFLAQSWRSHKEQLQKLQGIHRELALATELKKGAERREQDQWRAAAESSERRFRNLVEDIDAIVWEMDLPTLQITFVSSQAERILGYPVERWLSERNFWAEHIHPEDRDRVLALCRKAEAEGQNYDLEYRALAADGRVVWLRDIMRVVNRAQGPGRQLRGVMVDITGQKRADAELHRVNRALKTVSECNLALARARGEFDFLREISRIIVEVGGYRFAWVGYAEHDAAKYVSPVAQAGHEAGYLNQANITWAATERGRGPIGAAIRTNQTFVARNIATDPSFMPWREEALKRGYASMIALPLASGKEVLGTLNIYSAGTDAFDEEQVQLLTELASNVVYGIEALRARADRQRAAAEKALLTAAIEQSAEGVVITDLHGTIQYANPAFSRITAYSREEALGQNIQLLMAGQHDASFFQRFWDTVKAGGIWQGEVINRRRDGTLYPEEMTVAPVRNEPGEITHYIAGIQDVAERKRLEQQLQQAQKMEAVGRLAGGIAHDFNNLLTIIVGYSQLLQERLEPTSPLRTHAEEIRQAGERAASLTRQLLAFSRKQVLAPCALDLNSVVAGIDQMLRRMIGEDIDLLTLQGQDLGRVTADPGQIGQVIMNLAVNARDAMPNGGKLTLETAKVELDEAYAQSHFPLTPGRYVRLSVSDTGCGMDKETQAHIFEPFFTTKEKGKGTGLGLATVYGIVRQSGGFIWVYSELGRGTTFKIYLPLVSEPAAEVARPETGARSAGGHETILLVEDEASVRALARGILQSNGYKVLEAGQGSEALEVAQRFTGTLDLLLTDVVMPEMGGVELARRLQSLHPGVRVLYMSGYTDNAIVHHGVLDAGTPFLQKPFSPQALAHKVREALDATPKPSSLAAVATSPAEPSVSRRAARAPCSLPVTLVFESEYGTVEKSATTVNLSNSGLRIRTGIMLTRGQTLEVLSGGLKNRLERCRVVWARSAGASQPCEAGLEFLN